MITTVTTSTITTVTTVAAMGLMAGITIVALFSLIIFLSVKELTGATDSPALLRVSRFISVGILPLVIAFFVLVAVKVAELLA